MRRQVFSTALLTAGGDQKPCTVEVLADRVLVSVRFGTKMEIPLDQITQVLFEDRSRSELSMAGCSIDYHDKQGSARVMFFNSGWFPVSKTNKMVNAVQEAYNAYYADTSVPRLLVADLGAIRVQKANQVVHRNLK